MKKIILCIMGNKFRFSGGICKLSINDVIMKNCKFIVDGNNNEIYIDDGVRLFSCHINIVGNNNKIIINKDVLSNFGEFFIEDDNNLISIGLDTHLCGKIHFGCIEGTKIVIGNNCLFSSDILCQTGDAHSILNLEKERINPSKNIYIEDHVWIGARVIIGKGAYISSDTVVGYGAIITSEHKKNNVILAGVPAKVIKENIMWDRIRMGES